CFRNLLFAVPLSAISFATTPALADGCHLDIQDVRDVSAVVDALTLRIDDDYDVRLAGVEVAALKSVDCSKYFAGMIGQHVILRVEHDDPNRYGRQTGLLFLDHAARSVQSELLARGEALPSADVTNKACAAELAAAET